MTSLQNTSDSSHDETMGYSKNVKRKEPTGYVYFMTMEPEEDPYRGAPFVKIGYARDPDARLDVLKTGLPFEIDIDATFRALPSSVLQRDF
jgi:hypothetical protein